jgi:arylsulfatase A-like enzyme
VEELGLKDNTLIILTSDNGPLGSGPHEELDNNGPLRGAKRDLYEGGIRVPFIARWPGRIPAGQVSDEIVTFWDMLPTLAEIGGGSIPEGIDGISVVDALMGRPIKEPHEYLYWDYGHNRSVYHQAVRLGDFKGIRHGSSQPIELYHLKNDLGETRNVAHGHPDIVERILQIMETSTIPSDRYPVGRSYQGSAIWKASDRW